MSAITDEAAIIFPSVAVHTRDIKFQGELALLPGELLRFRFQTANEITMGNAFRLRLA